MALSADAGINSSAGPSAGRAVPPRPKPDLGVVPGWWPIALSEEVGQHPKAFRVGVRDVAVYRDLQGVVRAVDDSCPHRRLPLSMGRITQDGYLQCGYHGWCFDGASGVCTAIPNLHDGEKIPSSIRVAAFSTAENVADVLGWSLRTRALAPAVGPPTGEEPEDGTTMFETHVADGLVVIWTGDEAPEAATRPLSQDGTDEGRLSGRMELRAPHARVAEALLWNPGAVLGLGPLLGAGEDVFDPDVEVDGDTLIVRRERYASALARVATYGPLSRRVVAPRIVMVADTGLTRIEVPAAGPLPAARVVVGLTPIGPYRTIVRWRVQLQGGALPTALARALATGRRLTGRDVTGVERLADATEKAMDRAIDRLRELRAERGHTNAGETTGAHR
jgi:nitrite reductase/ring-hydroxylating ferredoxin subunit